MTKFILRWVINAIGLYLAILILPGIDLMSGLVSILWLAGSLAIKDSGR
jgi:uncharacterized membrane protein YvlD (DUF360 family)